MSWTKQTSTWLVFNSLNPIHSYENDVVSKNEIISIERIEK